MSLKCKYFFNLNLLEVYNVIHKHNLMCLAETYLGIFTSDDGSNLKVRGYVPVILSYSLDVIRVGVSIYAKNSVSLKFTIAQYLQNLISFKILIGNLKN